MSSIVRQKVGAAIYLYESTSFRNKDGKPRNKRIPIGKIDQASGQPIYKQEYLDRMAASGHPIVPSPLLSRFSIHDIHHSSIREYGLFYLFTRLAEKMGLLGVLRTVFPGQWEELFNLVAYLIATGDPYSYCEDWLEQAEAYPAGALSSQRISELLSGITAEERDDFYRQWCLLRSEKEYLALDITSASSYSELIGSVEWGYNRDEENLPQINICLLMGQESRYPIYQSVYAGSLTDVTTLRTTLSMFRAVAGEKPLIVVMDRGFYSEKNVTAMLKDTHIDFVISLPFTSTFALDLIQSERNDIDTLNNTIVHGNEALRAVTIVCRWDNEQEIYAHVYYNARKAQGIREDLYMQVATLRDQAMRLPERYSSNKDYKKYLDIRRSEADGGQYTVTVREDVVEAELMTSGWMVLITNRVGDAKEALTIYRDKDVVEKGFLRLKNSLDVGRLRVHSEKTMQNKVFVAFIALILQSAIHTIMVEQKLYRTMTMRKMILTLSKLKVQMVQGVRILFPVTKEQRDIYEAFGFPQPV